MKRRSFFALPAALVCLAPRRVDIRRASAGRRFRRTSRTHPRGPHTHRVIVQGAREPGSRRSSAGSPGGCGATLAQRRRASRSTTRSSRRCRRTPNFAHLSGDLPVVADMAVTNKVTGATSVWQGTPGAPRPARHAGLHRRRRRRRHPRLRHRDAHGARLARRRARQPRDRRTGRHGRSVRPRHAHRRHRRRQPDRGDRTSPRRSAAAARRRCS